MFVDAMMRLVDENRWLRQILTSIINCNQNMNWHISYYLIKVVEASV